MKEKKVESLTIEGVEYVPMEEVREVAKELDGMKYVIVRAHLVGVFAGYLANKEKDEVILKNARRLWYWDGAASLSQLAMEGVSKPENCKFPCEVASVDLLGVIEILDTTEKAKISINSVKIWEK